VAVEVEDAYVLDLAGWLTYTHRRFAMVDTTDPVFCDETKAMPHLEALRWPGGGFCPHCGSIDVHRMADKTQTGMFKCNNWGKFTTRIVSVIGPSAQIAARDASDVCKRTGKQLKAAAARAGDLIQVGRVPVEAHQLDYARRRHRARFEVSRAGRVFTSPTIRPKGVN
jgi:Transposase zinc-ribbon domain